MRTSDNKAYYAAAAARGRHVRFSMSINWDHVPEDVRKAYKERTGRTIGGSMKITRGTLTVDQAETIMQTLLDAVAPKSQKSQKKAP